MSLMNGVDSEEIIGKRINPNNILHSFIKVASQKKEDGYHFDPETTIGIILGELQPPFESERIKAINHLLLIQEFIESDRIYTGRNMGQIQT